MLHAVCVAALVLSVVVPRAAAGAEHATGFFDVAGQIEIRNPEDATASAAYGLLAPDLTNGIRLTISSVEGETAELCLLTQRWAAIRGPVPESRIQTFPLERDCRTEKNLRIEVGATAQGESYVGFYPEALSLIYGPGPRLKGEFGLERRLASDGAKTESLSDNQRDTWYYKSEVNRSHVLVTAPGTVTGTLTGAIKVFGVPLHVSSASGEWDYATGKEGPSAAVGEQTFRWAFVSFRDAAFTLETGAPFIAAVEELAARSSGEIAFRATSGVLLTPDATYSPRRAAVDHVVGSFSATLTPRDGGEEIGTLTLEGSVLSTSMTRVPAPVGGSPAVAGFSLLLLGAVLGGGAAAAVGVLLFKRHRARMAPRAALPVADDPRCALMAPGPVEVAYEAPLSAEQALEKATIAASWSDWSGALRFVRRARDADREDPRLRLTEGRYLRRLGKHEEALGAFEVAAVLGEPLGWLEAAVCALRLEQADPSVALSFLEKALKADPLLLEEIRREPAFDSLRESPEYQRLLREGSDPR